MQRNKATKREELLQKIDELENRLKEAEDTLRAIREGEVDAVIVSGTKGDQVFSLVGADSIYRLIVETMKEAAFTVTFEGTILYCNSQFCTLVNRPSEQIVGRPLLDFVSENNHADASLILVSAQHQPVKQRLVFRSSDGTNIPAHISANILNQPDGLSICVVANDLSDLENSTELIQQLRLRQEELRKNEALLRDVIETVADPIYVKDKDSRLILANPATVNIVGKPIEQIIGHSDRDFYENTDIGEKILENDRQVMESGKVHTFEETVQTPVGYRVVLNTKAPRRDTTGRIVGLVGVARDITERNKMIDELQKARDELENRVWERTVELEKRAQQLRSMALELTQTESRERKRLAAILHDNLQQLLVGAKLNIQAAQRKTTENEIKESIIKISTLIDESINVSRSLTSELSPPILFEGGLVPAVKWLARWMGDRHNLSVYVDSNAEIPPDNEGVTILLFQSIRELLFNIIKHAGVKEAMVSINIADNSQFNIVVVDNGKGFDVSQVEAGGAESGFGLFSIKERVNILGGQMDIESSPGSGTRVTLITQLPAGMVAKKTDPVIASAGSTTNMKKAIKSEDGSKIRVLVADDHEIVREGLSKLIQAEADMEIIGLSSNGEEAVEMACRLRPDIVVMDVNMPKMNGVEAAEKIIAEQPEIRIVCLSMFEKVGHEEALRKVGVAAYLSKDGPSDDIIAAIRAHADLTSLPKH